MPGISSIAAVPAAAGIPITHRGISDRVTIASCHGADGSDAEYARLAAIGGTLILFMGLGRVERVVDGLIAAGLPAETPAAAVSRGTLPDQEVVRAPLRHLAAAATGLLGPALLVIGDVAALELGSRLQAERLGEAEATEPDRAPGDRALAARAGEGAEIVERGDPARRDDRQADGQDVLEQLDVGAGERSVTARARHEQPLDPR